MSVIREKVQAHFFVSSEGKAQIKGFPHTLPSLPTLHREMGPCFRSVALIFLPPWLLSASVQFSFPFTVMRPVSGFSLVVFYLFTFAYFSFFSSFSGLRVTSRVPRKVMRLVLFVTQILRCRLLRVLFHCGYICEHAQLNY